MGNGRPAESGQRNSQQQSTAAPSDRGNRSPLWSKGSQQSKTLANRWSALQHYCCPTRLPINLTVILPLHSSDPLNLTAFA